MDCKSMQKSLIINRFHLAIGHNPPKNGSQKYEFYFTVHLF